MLSFNATEKGLKMPAEFRVWILLTKTAKR